MRVLGESWCFCNGGGKSERMKAAIFSGKAPAMARINGGGTGFLIHRNLLLTTHANLPSVAAVEAAEIRLHNAQSATLFPHRFFITSSVLDLTMVGLDTLDGESNPPTQPPHYLKTCSKPNLELGSIVYLLGYTEKQELTVGEGKVVIATDNLIKLSTDGVAWSPGSAGFDVHGNLAFMICDPMKLATSPNTKSSSTSSSSTSSWKKDYPMQFGIPIPIIRHWLSQHWEGNLDELNKPKLPLIRLMSSSGQKSEHSCASFTMRQVFKSAGHENDGTPTSSKVIDNLQDDNLVGDPQNGPHVIPTPEIYESPKMTSGPIGKKDDYTQIQLLDINFPPRIAKISLSPKQVPREPACPTPDAESTGSVNGAQSEIQSVSTRVEILELDNEYSSEGETTMYSAETAESRNFPSPREGRSFQQVGRSQSCVNHNRWGPAQKNVAAHGNFMRGRKVYSQGATSQRSNDYFSPTVSSIMKKRNLEQQSRPRMSSVHTSPKWNF
ncbi:hypothetical protein PHJA_002563100 [Phtheirospermum japonicum]|uniref:Uncharacterized protein n=1 Tax=Phtheirospermum japonicum TaxID=374723 RepID=A0A830DCY3_9LAMI|nr:hypothetical protein PHJA_002563100 [Phtheirospermum japonicum]